MPKDSLLICRQFDKKYDDTYRTIDLALQVDVWECVAYRPAQRKLDPLAEAVLSLMQIGIVNDGNISKTLDITSDLVKLIKYTVLGAHSYIDNDYKTLTTQGTKYLRDGESADFQSEKVFGNMFVNVIDQEVLPYFLEGKLPEVASFYNGINEILNDTPQEHNPTESRYWIPKFSKAFKLFGKIYKYSTSGKDNVMEYAEDELVEMMWDDVADSTQIKEEIDEKTLEEILASSQQIKLLDTTKKRVFLKTKMIISKESPKTFIVLSPFENNTTSWYNNRLEWVRENKLKLSDQGTTIDGLLDNIRDQFIIQFPELQEDKFEYQLGKEYSSMRRAENRKLFETDFKKLFVLTDLYEKDQTYATNIITQSHKLLERVLTNYVAKIPNKRNILERLQINNGMDLLTIKEIFGNFGISDCAVLRNNNWMNSIRNFKFSQYGSSVMDRYFLLTIDAYFSKNSLFRSVLESNGELIGNLDYLNRTRNKYGPHSDNIEEAIIPKVDFDNFRHIFSKVLDVLLNNLFKVE